MTGRSVVQFAFGTEDFDFDPVGSRLLVSAQERRKSHESGGERPEGAIWAVPVSPDGPGVPYAMTLVRDTGRKLHPVGISLVQDGGGQFLFVVNRDDKKGYRAIEVFRVDGDRLELQGEPLVSEHLTSPNDVLAVSRGECYVSNDSGSRKAWLAAAEKILRIPRGNVVHHGPEGWSVAAPSVLFANGLALSRNGDRLFVAAFLEKRIRVYSRRPDGSLDPGFRTIDLPSYPDNLLWEAEGRLVVACARNSLALARHISSPSKPSPSDVFRLDVGASPVRSERLCPDAVQEISGASTALVIGNRLYVSHLIGNGIQVVELAD